MSRGFHAQCLVWALVVIKANPVTNNAAGVLDSFKPVPVGTLFFKRTNHTLDHAVLLRTMGRDELLLQAIAADQGGVATARKNEPIVRAKQKRFGNTAQCPVTRD